MKSLVFLGMVLLASCQNRDNSSPGGPAQNPVMPKAETWTDVTRTEICTPPENWPMCLHGTFTVLNDARFTFDSEVRGKKEGALSAEDFKRLNVLVEGIDSRWLTRDLTCMEVMTIPEISANSLALTLPDRETTVLKELSSNGLCYRAEKEPADHLEAYLEVLIKKYVGS